MLPTRLSTVSTAATDFNLSTLVNVKTDLSISSSSEDAYLTRMLAVASKEAATYCGRVFVEETIDDTFYIRDCIGKLILSRFPVSEVVSVTVDGDVLDDALYRVEEDTGVIYRLDTDGELCDWDAEITVIRFKGGYSEIPADLEGAVIDLIKARRSARTRDPTVRSERVPDVMEVTYWVSGPGEGHLPPNVRGVFDHYRMARV